MIIDPSVLVECDQRGRQRWRTRWERGVLRMGVVVGERAIAVRRGNRWRPPAAAASMEQNSRARYQRLSACDTSYRYLRDMYTHYILSSWRTFRARSFLFFSFNFHFKRSWKFLIRRHTCKTCTRLTYSSTCSSDTKTRDIMALVYIDNDPW